MVASSANRKDRLNAQKSHGLLGQLDLIDRKEKVAVNNPPKYPRKPTIINITVALTTLACLPIVDASRVIRRSSAWRAKRSAPESVYRYQLPLILRSFRGNTWIHLITYAFAYHAFPLFPN